MRLVRTLHRASAVAANRSRRRDGRLASERQLARRPPATPKRGGSITIARIEDSQSFDKTNVFQNESIWLTQQIMEPLYTVDQDGKTLKPWLATSYTKSKDGKTYTFKLRHGVQVLER